jgi:hypothetical protein
MVKSKNYNEDNNQRNHKDWQNWKYLCSASVAVKYLLHPFC